MANYQSNLINEIKKHPCLFIEDNAVYRDPELKNKAWNEISLKLNLDVAFLQNEWQKLQESYGIILFSRSRSKDSSTSRNQWKFEEQMKFMEYYLQPKQAPLLATDSLTEQGMVLRTLEPELMEISSSEIANKTTGPEREIISSTLRQSSKIHPQGCTATSIGMKLTVGDKAPFPGHRLKNSIRFCNTPENYDTMRIEADLEKGKAPPPVIIQKFFSREKTSLPEIRTGTIETEVIIVADSYQQGNGIPGRENVGLHKGSDVFSRIEVPLPEITNETIETEVMIVYEGNPLDNRILRRENVDFNDDFLSGDRSHISLPSPPQVESEVISPPQVKSEVISPPQVKSEVIKSNEVYLPPEVESEVKIK